MYAIISIVLFIILMVKISSLEKRLFRLERGERGVSPSSGKQPEAQRASVAQVSSTEPVLASEVSVNPTLLNYIEQSRAQGISFKVIEESLLNNGWNRSDVDAALSSFDRSGEIFEQREGHEDGKKNYRQDLNDRFIEWLKKDWLVKLGALLLLVGFGWFVTYAFMENWIGELGRISLGIIVGALFLPLGFMRMKKYLNQGGIFMVLGSTIILLTVFAARNLYDFFDPISALLIMFLSVALVALAGARYKSFYIILSSLILAAVAPLLTDSSSDSSVFLFSYLTVITLGTLWIVFVTGMRELVLASLLIVSIYSFPYWTGLADGNLTTLLLFAYSLAGIFFFVSLAGIIKEPGKESISDLATALLNGFFILLWIITVASPEWQSLIIALWMLLFVGGAFVVFRLSGSRKVFYLYSAVSLIMLGSATAVQLKDNQAALSVAYTLEAGLIVYLSYILTSDIRLARRLSGLMAIPIFFSFFNIFSSSWRQGFLHSDFFILLILMIVLGSLGWLFLRYRRDDDPVIWRQFNPLLIASSIYLYLIIWLALHSGFYTDFSTMFALVVYAVIGLVAYFGGLIYNLKSVKTYGTVFLVLIMIRLAIVDIWNMDLAYRIVVFFIIGGLFLATAFLSRMIEGGKHQEPNN